MREIQKTSKILTRKRKQKKDEKMMDESDNKNHLERE